MFGCVSSAKTSVSSTSSSAIATEARQPILDDDAVKAQRSSFQQAYSDIEKLSTRKNNAWPVSSYFATKAWAWTEFAEQEWQERDLQSASQQALTEARKLVLQMQSIGPGEANQISMQTSHIPASRMVRDDIWVQVAGFKQHQGFDCAQPEIAELEVTLVHAGHEYEELGWRHARSEILAAERLAREIPKLLAECAPPAPVVACNCEADLSLDVLPKYVYFALDSDELNQAARRKLDDVVHFMRTWPEVTILLEGHADMLANAFYNLGLSARRAQAVSNYLQLSGVPPQRVGTRAFGEQRPRGKDCSAEARALDRRVEIYYFNASNIELNEDDLGIEVETMPLPSRVECTNQ